VTDIFLSGRTIKCEVDFFGIVVCPKLGTEKCASVNFICNHFMLLNRVNKLLEMVDDKVIACMEETNA
jgi:hypothetical protein